MSVKRFKFVSPGVFVNEIDNSQLPAVATRMGPVVVGRMERGPAMRPVTVASQAEFVEMFGLPIPGGQSGDIWREGNYQSPTYGGYAAMAYLRNNSPVTVVRLLGAEHENNSAGSGQAGWKVDQDAFGLFLWDSGSDGANDASKIATELTGTLAAIWYFDSGVVALSGTMHEAPQVETESTCVAVRSVGGNKEFKATVYDNDACTNKVLETTFNFDRNSEKFIRRVFNTNPALLEGDTISSENAQTYFLGQTFEDSLPDYLVSGSAGNVIGMIVKLENDANSKSYQNFKLTGGAQNATSGWVISQQLGSDTGSFNPKNAGVSGQLAGCSRLFTFNALDCGEWESSNLKISVEDIRYSHNENENPYGSFTVAVRKTTDNDGNPQYVEQFSNCNLNPSSTNYVKRKIGDQTLTWDEGERRYKTVGDYPNNSKFIVCEVNPDLDNAALDPQLLPFGFQGPPQLKPIIVDGAANQTIAELVTDGTSTKAMFHLTSAVQKHTAEGDGDDAPVLAKLVITATDVPDAGQTLAITFGASGTPQVITFVYGGGSSSPLVFTTNAATIDFSTLGGTHVGLATQIATLCNTVNGYSAAHNSAGVATITAATAANTTYDLVYNEGTGLARVSGVVTAGAADDVDSFFFGNSNLKLVFPKPRCRTSSDEGNLSNRKQASWGITTIASGSTKERNRGWGDLMYPLPDNIGDTYYDTSFAMSLDDIQLLAGVAYWGEGKRNALVPTALSIQGTADDGTGTYKTVIDAGIDSFVMPLWGGFDGLDIQRLDPFSPDKAIGPDATDKGSYEYYSVRKAIDTCADPEVVECNLITAPGITNNGINQHLINVAENRADCLAILDLDGGYVPRANRTSGVDFSVYGGSVTDTLSNLKNLAINSSYACSYYPWVQVRDTESNAVVWVPPSVVALGTMGSSEVKSEVWFAPAGFTRGGLSEGSAGLPVVGVRDRLTSKQRDDLYTQNVNPIATFPAEGIVIFGQKTMQITPSALDRINVRRLLIFVKKEISRMAATTLFEQNVQRTWNRFLGQVNPFLRGVKARLGLTAFKVILDETTTTPELIDRNIMYAKILLKPARAIEFIAIDFVITNSGASFED